MAQSVSAAKPRKDGQLIPRSKAAGQKYEALQEKVELLANNYHEANNTTRDYWDQETEELIKLFIEESRRNEAETEVAALTSPNNVKKIIGRIKPFKAAGEDKIQGKLLKNLPQKR